MNAVSVLTIQKGRLSHLSNLIEGLRRSTTPTGELVVVSMDSDAPALPPAGFPIRLIHQPSVALPLAHARNVAARSASFERLLFLDIDCIPMRGLVAAVDDALNKFDGLLCAEIQYLAADQVQPGWTEDELRAKAVKHPLRNFPAAGLVHEKNAGLFWSLAFAMHRKTFFSLGGFDESFTGYGAEDTDFSFRAARAGRALAFLGGAGAFHQHHEIYDPPLQHFDDIIRNARVFHGIHRHWPMQGWLDSFAALGLISVTGNAITNLRGPSPAEFENARKTGPARF